MVESYRGLGANYIAAAVDRGGSRYPSASHPEADRFQRDLAVHDRQVHDKVVERHRPPEDVLAAITQLHVGGAQLGKADRGVRHQLRTSIRARQLPLLRRTLVGGRLPPGRGPDEAAEISEIDLGRGEVGGDHWPLLAGILFDRAAEVARP